MTEKCDGCKGQEKTACMYICPNDLMKLDRDRMKAFNQEPDQCWECYNCVKICPQQAIEVRGYAEFMPLGGSIIPLRASDSCMWTIKYRNGMIKRFKFPHRTTPDGSIEPYKVNGQELGEPNYDNIKKQNLCTDTRELPVIS
jgi:adenylylsulfate reductase subunit B